jgi:hypothetical protein
MERRFLFDFGRVRVHTDGWAVAAARRLGARAFALGQDLCFGEGRYAPDPPAGRRLLAHELAHVVQADPGRAGEAGGHERDAEAAAEAVVHGSGPVAVRASTRHGTVLRQEAAEASEAAPEPPVGRLPLTQPTVRQRLRLLDEDLERPEGGERATPLSDELRLSVFADEAVEAALSRVLLALARVRGTPAAQGVWRHVVDQVRAPRARIRRDAPPELYEPGVVEVLQELTPGRTTADGELGNRRRAEVLERLFTRLLTSAEIGLGTDPAAIGDAEREWALLEPTTTKHLEGKNADAKRATYGQVRLALLAKFGALEVGTDRALERVNAFYRDEIETATFLGKDVIVHHDMAASLVAAAKKLTAEEKTALTTSVKSVGGVSIRFNVNNPLALSEHSFGAAVDINPETNPNVPRFPVDFVEAVTDMRLMVTPGGRRKADLFDLGEVLRDLVSGTKDPAQREMERMIGASDRLRAAFRDEPSVGSAMTGVARRRLARLAPGTSAATLLAAARAARAEGRRVRWRYEDPRARLPRGAPVGSAHETLAELVYPLGARAGLPEPFDQWDYERQTVELLIQMADVFERSFVRLPAGVAGPLARVKPEARAPGGAEALPQLAAHGFVDIPATLISALRAVDGGNLLWLGAGDHVTKDFMHFELKTSPALW